ncbi:hypothetical protein EDC04DRAFT_1529087 [Pisolithus marmoratus]|nr:hypothetical protein EDC04DRAFT_1529087 [Pisolithus marmoratus]
MSWIRHSSTPPRILLLLVGVRKSDSVVSLHTFANHSLVRAESLLRDTSSTCPTWVSRCEDRGPPPVCGMFIEARRLPSPTLIRANFPRFDHGPQQGNHPLPP